MPRSLSLLLIWEEGMTPAQLKVVKGHFPSLVQISQGLNLMHLETCCKGDKAHLLSSSSKDSFSLISTTSAILAPPENPPQRHADVLRDITAGEQTFTNWWQ